MPRGGGVPGGVDLKERYLDLVEAVVTGTVIEDPPIVTPYYRGIVSAVLTEMYRKEIEAPDHALGYNPRMRETGRDWPSRAFTMVGRARLRNFRYCIETALTDGIAGDILEAGVWRGGACIFARAVLAAHGVTDRRVIVADSFAGLPPPDLERYPQDAGSTLHEEPDLAVSVHAVRENFARMGLLDDQVAFVPGYFRDTMPGLATGGPIAVLRLDGDMYESTIDPLRYLYDLVPPGGFLIVDDYGIAPACRQAVADFFGARGGGPALHDIDGIGAWLRK